MVQKMGTAGTFLSDPKLLVHIDHIVVVAGLLALAAASALLRVDQHQTVFSSGNGLYGADLHTGCLFAVVAHAGDIMDTHLGN
jgi:hypothetical protein